MLKKILALGLIAVLLCTAIPVFADSVVTTATEYELWTQSPSITSGVTDDELRIYKAVSKGEFELYNLSKLGSNYFLGICEGKVSDGGYNGKTKTSELYYYLLLATNDSFIILSKATMSNEYFWDYTPSFADISSQINASNYASQGLEVPYYIVSPNGKYTNYYYTEYDEYFFITSAGKIYKTAENANYGAEGYPFIYNRILYRGAEKYSSGSSNYYYLDDNTTKATQYQQYQFSGGSIIYGTAMKVATTEVTAANGYQIYREGFTSNVSAPNYYKIPDTVNLYYTISQPYVYDAVAGRSYYYLQIDVFRCIDEAMNLYKTKTIPTTNTYQTTITVKSLGALDDAYYANRGVSVPKAVINKNCVIMQDGTIGQISLDSTIYNPNYWEIAGYNNRLVVIRSQNGTSTIYEKDENGTYYYWQKLNYIYFNSSGTMTKEADISLKCISGGNAGQNGFFASYSSFVQPNFATPSYTKVSDWWGHCRSNVFPDGRYVTLSWVGMGGNLQELWYNIYNADDSLRATGPTGYSSSFASSFSTYPIAAFVVNNSKFIATLNMVERDWSKEYYRVAVVQESETGEIMGGGQLGNKNIAPPDTTDTEPVQRSIDFAQDDLPIGYNIKNNVIDSNKLDSGLRQQVNTIRLNNIVIIKKSGYISGTQNTGTTLSSYSYYDYSFGSDYIRIYSNGQNFLWYCYNPQNLNVGTYNKTYYIGDKTVYVTVKVIAPPSINSVTTVTF